MSDPVCLTLTPSYRGALLYTRRQFVLRSAIATTAAVAMQQVLRADDIKKPTGRRVLNEQIGSNEVVKLAIVGTGQISHRYLKQAQGNEKVRFVATCARTLQSARARAEEYGIENWFDDYEAMYDKVKPDGVIIATPSSIHAAPAIAAFKRGVHVLCEKPMATSFNDCEAMVAAAEKSGVVFLALPFNATAGFLTAIGYLNEATLGAFTGAEAQLNIEGHPRANWYYDKDVAGGVMLDTMIYPVARLIEMLGPAKRVAGFANTLIPRRIIDSRIVTSNIDDNVSLIVEWSGGQQALFRALWGTSMDRFDAYIYGRHGTLIAGVFGDEVVIHSPRRPIAGAEAFSWYGHEDCYRPSLKPMAHADGEGHIDHFVDCIRGRSQPTCGGRQQLHIHEILFKGYEAARTGCTQELKTTFTPWHSIDPGFFDTRSRPL
jgi:predicted dehydrogenase